MGSVEFEAKRNSKAVAVWLLHIHFDAFFLVAQKDFYFSTTKNIEFEVASEIEVFRGRLRDVPKGRHQKDRSNDYAEFYLSNPNNDTYQDFLDYENHIEKGEVTIYECYEIEKDYYEGEVRFVGYLKNFTVNESNKSLDFTAVSDMSRTGFNVGARILTRERCGTEFNYGGLNSPEFHHCGWQLIQGGNLDFCSKYLKGVDSCVAHGNAHRFYALPALAIAAIEFVPSGEIDFPYGTGGCFTAETRIVLPDWTTKPIHKAKEDETILGFDIFTRGVVETKIVNVQRHIVQQFVIAEFKKGGRIETTREHLFNTKGALFAPCGVLEGKTVFGLNFEKKIARDTLKSLTGVFQHTIVYNLQTTCSTFMITNAEMNFFYDVHNSKQHTPVEF